MSLNDMTVPKSFKVDLETPLESALTWLTIICALICLLILRIGLLPHKNSPPDPSVLFFLIFPLLAGLLFFLLRRWTDNFYLFDRERGQVRYHFQCAFFRQVSPYLEFDEILGTVVNGKMCQSKSGRWYEYALQVIDRHGTFHQMSDWLRDDQLTVLNQRAQAIGQIVGCEVLAGKIDHQILVATDPREGVRFSQSHQPLMGSTASGEMGSISLVNIFIGVMVALLLLFGLFTLLLSLH
jgi:hypothetical protein